MVSLFICNSNLLPKSPPLRLLQTNPFPPSTTNSSSLPFHHRKTRGLSLVTRGAPGTSTYIFAFFLPLSLLAITVFTSIRIADKLDRDFLEEVRSLYLLLLFFFVLAILWVWLLVIDSYLCGFSSTGIYFITGCPASLRAVGLIPRPEVKDQQTLRWPRGLKYLGSMISEHATSWVLARNSFHMPTWPKPFVFASIGSTCVFGFRVQLIFCYILGGVMVNMEVVQIYTRRGRSQHFWAVGSILRDVIDFVAYKLINLKFASHSP